MACQRALFTFTLRVARRKGIKEYVKKQKKRRRDATSTYHCPDSLNAGICNLNIHCDNIILYHIRNTENPCLLYVEILLRFYCCVFDVVVELWLDIVVETLFIKLWY